MSDNIMTPAQAGNYIRFAVSTLRGWRAQGIGPAFTRTGRQVTYLRSDIDTWLDNGTVAGAAA